MKDLSFRRNDVRLLLRLLKLAGFGRAEKQARDLVLFYGSLTEIGRADEASLADRGLGSCGSIGLLQFYIRYTTRPEERELWVTDLRGLKWAIFSTLCDLEREQLLVYPVRDSGRVDAPEIVHDGRNLVAALHEAEAIAEAHRCRYILLAHNHPRGSCQPSDSDVRSTRIFSHEISERGLRVIDHYIVSPTGICSLKEMGKFFDYEKS
ncbi:MAG: hypothetical protein IJ746_05875 [Ruminococcus sp.]|nr:hypothetical protein [Ruminococcus sp.]